LARRFRSADAFYGDSWAWQSGRFRGWFNYNHCLHVGATPEALYLRVQAPFQLFQPPLLIPWREIEVTTGKVFFGSYDTALLRLGSQEQVGFRVYGALVSRLRQAAASSWPQDPTQPLILN